MSVVFLVVTVPLCSSGGRRGRAQRITAHKRDVDVNWKEAEWIGKYR